MSSSPIRSGPRFFGFRRTITFRLTLWYGITFAVCTLLLVLIAVVAISRSLESRDRQLIREKLDAYAIDWERGGLEALGGEVEAEHRTHTRRDTFLRLADRSNQTQLIDVSPALSSFDWHALERTRPEPDQLWMELPAGSENERVEIAIRHLSDGSLIEVGKGTDERDDVMERLIGTFAVVIVPIMLLGLAGGAWLTRRALSPIQDLTKALRPVVETGSLDDRAPIRAQGNELDDLAALFNRALERITQLITGMRQSLDHVAHDLRTPMTRLRATAELALQSTEHGREPAQAANAYREALSDCLEESSQVLTMLNAMMDVSEAESGAMKLNLQPTGIFEIMEEVVDIYQYTAEEKQVQLHVRERGELIWVADPNRLRQALANLIDNAVKYSSPGGIVELEAHAEDGELVISVADSGMGIAADDLHRIWDRLYRGDKSRSQRGLGLGLSMVRAIIHAHHGRVGAVSEVGSGSTFRLYLPASVAAPAT